MGERHVFFNFSAIGSMVQKDTCMRLNLLRVASSSGLAIVALTSLVRSTTSDPPDFTLALGMTILTLAVWDEDFAAASLADMVAGKQRTGSRGSST